MKLFYGTPTSCVIQRRTFEGISNPDKNRNALTSKYMPSYKYYIDIGYEGGRHAVGTHRTKGQAQEFYDRAVKMAGEPL